MNDQYARHQARTEHIADRVSSRLRKHARIGLALAAIVGAVLIPISAARGGSGGTSLKTDDGNRYDRLWHDLSRKNRSWAHRTSECESGDDPHAHGGGGTYHGAFQFMLSTWKDAPRSPGGDPHEKRWRVQAVVAVYEKKRDGASNWPNCG
jgi:hypothetical protein